MNAFTKKTQYMPIPTLIEQEVEKAEEEEVSLEELYEYYDNMVSTESIADADEYERLIDKIDLDFNKRVAEVALSWIELPSAVAYILNSGLAGNDPISGCAINKKKMIANEYDLYETIWHVKNILTRLNTADDNLIAKYSKDAKTAPGALDLLKAYYATEDCQNSRNSKFFIGGAIEQAEASTQNSANVKY